MLLKSSIGLKSSTFQTAPRHPELDTLEFNNNFLRLMALSHRGIIAQH